MLHQLGAGVLGPVFRAHDPDADRLVAIKLFQLDFTPEQSRALAEHLEHLAATWPAHPALVGVLAGGLEGHAPYLVSEYVPADSLDARLRRRVAGGFRQLQGVLAQVAEALDAAAVAGLAHGGLHPRDILVATTGETRVTGVGIAQAIEAAGGRPPLRRPYAAPEQTGRLGWDHRADIFALGVLATELLAGRRPAGGGATASTLSDLLVQSEGLDPEACRRALSQALAEAPGARPRRAADLIAMLRAAEIEPEADEQEPLDLPLHGSSGAGQEGHPLASPTRPETSGEAFAAGATLTEGGPTDADSATPDEELAAVLAGEDPDTSMVAVPGAEESPVTPTSDRPPDAVRLEPVLTIEAPVEPRPDHDTDDEAVYGAPVRVSGLGPERDTVSPVGREFLDPAPPIPSRSVASLLVLLAAGVLAGLLGGYLLWGRDRVDGPSSPPSSLEPRPAGGADVSSATEPVTEEPLAPPVTAETRPAGPSTPAAAAPVVGRLVVRSTPSGARVIVDGRARGATPLTLVDLPLGTYGVRVVHDGFAERSQRVALTRGRPDATLTITLPRLTPTEPARKPAGSASSAAAGAARPAAPQAAPAATSRLDVVSRPSGARVLLDGRAVGTTPLTLAAVGAGPHTIRLELEGYRPWTQTLQVRGGTASRVAASLEVGERR